MSELTKEELEILCDLCLAHKSKYTDNQPLKYLAEKIQAIIDNYCEHEPDDYVYLSTSHQFKCKKCGKFY